VKADNNESQMELLIETNEKLYWEKEKNLLKRL